ncbi:MAG: DUF1501 domain-containing protein [Planctomycetes bacterium]|nr:DUF1501 domain-containing protein [Planctomycetota bacterium]
MHDLTRRTFLNDSLLGLGSIAFASLGLPRRAGARTVDDARRAANPPRARRVIYLHMAGSPPQMDLFDEKPRLQRLDGTPCPKEFVEGKRLAFIKGRPILLGSPHGFRQVHDGLSISTLLPHFARVVDRVTLVRSMTTDQFNHAPAQLMMHTGSSQFGHASMGAWTTYGLGTLNANLPAYCVMISGGTDPSGGKSLWASGYLPPEFQGVQLRSGGDPILFVQDPPGMDRALRRDSLDALQALNREELEAVGDPAIRARMEQYELAYRMQVAVPEVVNLRDEDDATLALYGARPGEASFANNCLLARRLVEAGVRYVQLYDWGWDVHGTGTHDDLLSQFPKKCREIDRPMSALILDLERRGLLDDTLVVWGGEFGRTAMNEARGGSTFLGRDHHPDCFSIWMAGGGVKRGYVHGETDELCYSVVRDAVTVHDLQATILHLLGLDPYALRYPYKGLQQRLIGPEDSPRIQHALLA